MRKLLLTIAGVASLCMGANAQTRLILYEEFTGENCPPCAQYNPALDALCDANSTKIIKIQYQSPIPSAGPIYLRYTADYQNRKPYYNVPFAPYGRIDGTEQTGSSPGHVAYLTQTVINNEYGISSPFNITVTHSYNAATDTVTATINVTCVTAFAPAGGQLKLRVALTSDLKYPAPPGTNGEIHFPNTVMRMYPDGSGTAIANAWTMGQTQSYTIKGYVPDYVDKGGETKIVAWIQNDADKLVAQAAVSTPVVIPTDMRSDLTAGDLACATSTVSVPGTVILKNVGTTPLTSATIYYRVDNGSWSNQAWTGNLAPNATANVSISFAGVPTGNHILNDSIFVSNDYNMGNSLSGKLVTVINSTPNALPISDSFSSSLKANWINKDLNQNGSTWQLVSSPAGNGHSVSYYMRHLNTSIPAGDTNFLILPTPNLPAGQKAIDFWYGYRRWDASSGDQMDVLYSSNCGQTWTALWSKSGANLATIGDSAGYWQISRYQWVFKSLDMSAVPSGSIVAFRAISMGGNNLYLDDVNIRAGAPNGIDEIVNSGLFQLYPNPAKNKVSLSFVTSEKANITVEIIDVVGHVVSSMSNALPAGAQKLELSTEKLASGIYNLKIGTDKGYHIERLTVVK